MGKSGSYSQNQEPPRRKTGLISPRRKQRLITGFCLAKGQQSRHYSHPHANAGRDRSPADNNFRRDCNFSDILTPHLFFSVIAQTAKPPRNRSRLRPGGADSAERRIQARVDKHHSSPSTQSSFLPRFDECL